MEKLLHKWAELAPDECRVKDFFGVDIWELMGLDANYQEPFKGTVIIATMQAIENRGWRWSFPNNERIDQDEQMYLTNTNRYEARIYTTWDYFGEKRYTDQDVVISYDSPAAALLSAYLQALAEVL